MTAATMNITPKNTISGGDKLRKPFTIETRFAGPASIPCREGGEAAPRIAVLKPYSGASRKGAPLLPTQPLADECAHGRLTRRGATCGCARTPDGPQSSKPVDGEPFSVDRKSTRLNSSHVKISYAVFCLKK